MLNAVVLLFFSHGNAALPLYSQLESSLGEIEILKQLLDKQADFWKKFLMRYVVEAIPRMVFCARPVNHWNRELAPRDPK